MDFQVISELSGVEPTCIEVKGEQIVSRITGERMSRISEHNTFEYHLPESHGKIVQRQYNKLMRTIKNSKQLGEYCKSHGIKIYVQVVIEGITDTYSFPDIGMDKKFISFLSDLNATVDFDIYTEPWDKEGDDYKQPAIVLPSGECLYKI
ncbi:MAG: DUF4279 domain-containing protein [Bacteroidales bacterium]|nr:DUF4279 domain-containing protein [Bacteroidales bacterium]